MIPLWQQGFLNFQENSESTFMCFALVPATVRLARARHAKPANLGRINSLHSL
eukprot:CAMPEP_0172755802 /NCGR_PEP_ID=MMETSP1074-20121228/160581_1 /TAXON_ID=2916 /ORGANISM="Ceratium fusus, Strain PA161109" /LENGTH=52 /DNA_ID=CAMNT_0013588969 /DNA_START=41 /DNA_END=196 /DNA_ORIENTATION=-